MALIINRSMGYEYRWHLPSIPELRDIHHFDIGVGLHEIPFAIIFPVYALIDGLTVSGSIIEYKTNFLHSQNFLLSQYFLHNHYYLQNKVAGRPR